MSETNDIVCQLRSASGRSNGDCVMLGRRFRDDLGPRAEQRDFWILVNEPVSENEWMTYAFWSFRSFVTGIWRAPSGKVYATDADLGGFYLFHDIKDLQRGAEHVKLHDVAPEGVWGLADDCIFVWGTRVDERRQKTYPVFKYDGTQWRELPPLPCPTNRIHGVSEDVIYASGWHGMVAKWDGSAWQRISVPTSTIVTDIYVDSGDEIYAVTNDGVLLEGSASDWGVGGSNPLGATPFSSVAKFRGEVYIGANDVGLMKRASAGGAVEEFKPKLGAVHIEARDNLIITCDNRVAGSLDGSRFFSIGTGKFAELTANKPLPVD